MSTISQLNINGTSYDIMDADARASINTIGEKLYPVGSIYLSLNNTNPATLFGFGTWESLASGYALWTNTDANALGTTAAASNTGSTSLNANHLPAHTHAIGGKGYAPSFSNNGTFGTITSPSSGSTSSRKYFSIASGETGLMIASTGNNTTTATGHTHTTGTPARIYVHAWKRTA